MPIPKHERDEYDDDEEPFDEIDFLIVRSLRWKWRMRGLIAGLLVAVAPALAGPFLMSDPAVPEEGAIIDWNDAVCVVHDLTHNSVSEAPLTPARECRVDMAGVPPGLHNIRVWFGFKSQRCCIDVACTAYPRCPNGPSSDFSYTRPSAPMAPTAMEVEK